MLNFPSLKHDHGETIDMLRSTVQAFAAAEIAPRAAQIDREHLDLVRCVLPLEEGPPPVSSVAPTGAIESWKFTLWLASGAPAALSTLNFTAESDVPAPLMFIMFGVAETNSRLPACAAFTMMIDCAGGNVPAVACMITPPVIEGSAVNVTDATPFTVLAASAESAPANGGREAIAKFTVVPSDTALFMMFITFAVMFVVCPFVRFELTMFMLIVAGSLVIKKLALAGARPPAAACTVTAPEDIPA